MLRLLIVISFFFTFTGCEGSYKLTGTVCERKDLLKIPIDSVSIKIYVNKDNFRGSTYSNYLGTFSQTKLTTPFKTRYYFVFEKAGFLSDTIIMQGSKGKSEFTLEHFMIRK